MANTHLNVRTFFRRTATSLLVAGTAFSATIVSSGTALAAPSIDISDPASTLSPALIGSAGGSDLVESQNSGEKVELQFDTAEPTNDLTVELPDGFQTKDEKSGFDVAISNDQDGAIYARASEAAGQVIFVADDQGAVSDFYIDFTKEIVEKYSLPDKELGLVFADGSSVVVLAPWALDAQGAELPTNYSISGSRIIQNVGTENAQFPIVADPAWNYAYTYDINKAPSEVEAKLREPGRFNQIFPVAGAPADFPTKDQHLPLTVGPWNFNCLMNEPFSGQDSGERWWGFSFRAAEGHVDGVGSKIKFTFTETLNAGIKKLFVNAYIVNDNPTGLPRSLYLSGAKDNWQNFANNINNS